MSLSSQASDPDLGINSDVRYQILNDQSQRFGIDPVSGQVRAVASFSREAGKVFGFDVKATDRQGADDGKSAIANVFVSSHFPIYIHTYVLYVCTSVGEYVYACALPDRILLIFSCDTFRRWVGKIAIRQG